MDVKHRPCVIRQDIAERRGPDEPCAMDKAIHSLEASPNRSRQGVESCIRRQVARNAEEALAVHAIRLRRNLRPIHRADRSPFRQQAFDDRLPDSAGRTCDNRAQLHR